MALDVYFREDIRNALQAVAVAHGPMGKEAQQVWLAMGLAFGLSWGLTVGSSQAPGVVDRDARHTLMIQQSGGIRNESEASHTWSGHR